MKRMSGYHKVILVLSGVLLFAGAAAALIVVGVIPMVPNAPGQDTIKSTECISDEQEGVATVTPVQNFTPAAEVVGSEVYDFSLYEESSMEYAQALSELEDPWLPRKAVVKPKGPEGGEYPNAPLPVYTAYPGQEGETEDGETYKITRTWIGDIAVGTVITLEGVAQQGEWCFVSGETIGGWNSSGWAWCYRLFITE
ncbi:MAG: hypothetical protein R6U57_10605 [Anaerolineales bacterium]